MELAETIASQLAHYDEKLTTPEIAAMTASIVAVGAYKLDGDKLTPSSREAVAMVAHFVPRAFLRGIAEQAVAHIEQPSLRTMRLFELMGSSFDDSISNAQARASGGA